VEFYIIVMKIYLLITCT